MPAARSATSLPTSRMTPATSAPGEKGNGGLVWYLPWTIRPSKKLMPQALTLMTTWPGAAFNGATSSITKVSTSAKALQRTAFTTISPVRACRFDCGGLRRGRRRGGFCGRGRRPPRDRSLRTGRVGLNGPVDHLAGHIGCGHFDHGDFGARAFVADRVHHVCGLQHQKARLVDHDAGFGDAFQRDRLLGNRAAKGDAAFDAFAHFLKRTFGQADGAHGVVDAPGAQAALGDFETTPLAQQHIRRGHAHGH